MNVNKRFTWLKKDVYAPQVVITDSLTGKDLTPTDCYELLNNLHEENQSLKEQLSEAKADEKQLGISFMEFKMKLIDVLQRNYEYAENQRQKYLDNAMIEKPYDMMRITVKGIADELGVDIN